MRREAPKLQSVRVPCGYCQKPVLFRLLKTQPKPETAMHAKCARLAGAVF